MDRVDAAMVAKARAQHGLVEMTQYVGLGGSRARALRRCEWGVWEQMYPTVFRIGGYPLTLDQRLMAAVLASGPGAVVSHRAAEWLWGVRIPGGVPLELSGPRPQMRKRSDTIWHRSRDLNLAGVSRVRGIPVTGLPRTLLDIGAVAPALVRPALWEGMRSHGLSWGDVLGVLVDHSKKGRRGIGALRAVVDEHYGQIAGDSRTEDRAFEILCDSQRVPIPERLIPVMCADGVEVTPDFLWPEYRLILEVFGADHLLNESVQQIDAHRINQLEIAGYATLVYTGKMLRKAPEQLVRDVASILSSRGWSGILGA